MKAFEKSKWIWYIDKITHDDYAEFRDSFIYRGGDVKINISADTDYTLWINGKYVCSNQYDDFEHYKIYDTVELTQFLAEGKNDMLILVYHSGVSCFNYAPAAAGVIYEVVCKNDILAYSNKTVQSRRSPAYECGKEVCVSWQLGFTFFYNARKEKEGGFAPSFEVNKSLVLLPRPIKKAKILERQPMKILSKNDNGTHYVIDLGREVVGLPTLELLSNGGGTVTVAWAERMINGEVKKVINDRHFYYEYKPRAGHNLFTNYILRIACRYLEITSDEPIQLEYCGVLPQIYEIGERPVHINGDTERTIYDMCVNTLRLCMMEHYVDCPWREQGLYACDSRNQMLSGFYAFDGANAEYARANLKLIGQDRRSDNLLSICYPTSHNLSIPTFSLYYILEMAEYLRYTGDTTLASELYGKMKSILDAFVGNMKDGLIERFSGEDKWNFYDWADGLTGSRNEKGANEGPDLIINCLFILAAEQFEGICRATKNTYEYGDTVSDIRKNVREKFIDECGLLSFTIGDGNYTELGNSLAVLSGILSPDETERVCDKIVEGGLVPTNMSMCVWAYDALLTTNTEKYRNYVLKRIKDSFAPMIDAGYATVWEYTTLRGDASSACHGWSAIPVYIYHRLGIAKYI